MLALLQRKIRFKGTLKWMNKVKICSRTHTHTHARTQTHTHTPTPRCTEFNVFWLEDTFIFHTESQRHYIYRFWLRRLHTKLGGIIQIQHHHPRIKWSKSHKPIGAHTIDFHTGHLFSAFRISHNPSKNVNSVITYSPSCQSKSVCLTFFCQTQKKVFWTLYWPLFSMLGWSKMFFTSEKHNQSIINWSTWLMRCISTLPSLHTPLVFIY